MESVGELGEAIIVRHLIDELTITHKNSGVGHTQIELEYRSIRVHELPIGTHWEHWVKVWRVAQQPEITVVGWCWDLEQFGLINVFLLVCPVIVFAQVSRTGHGFGGGHG